MDTENILIDVWGFDCVQLRHFSELHRLLQQNKLVVIRLELGNLWVFVCVELLFHHFGGITVLHTQMWLTANVANCFVNIVFFAMSLNILFHCVDSRKIKLIFELNLML